MVIRVPDTLNVDNSEKYNVSIRLWPDGLSFSGYIPSERNSFFSEAVTFDRETPPVEALKAFFFDNECLSYVYHSLLVVFVSGRYTLAPDSIFNEKNKELLFSCCFRPSRENPKVLSQPLKPFGASLLFEVDNASYEFLMRSLINPQFIHFLSPMLSAWHKRSVACYPKQMYAFIHDSLLEIACFEQGEILFVNTFDYETENDLIYFLLYVCKQLALNQLEDSIVFCGDKTVCRKVMPVINNYMVHVDFLPSDLKHYHTAPGKEVHADVATLVECGL
jgi:hypothetical protein